VVPCYVLVIKRKYIKKIEKKKNRKKNNDWSKNREKEKNSCT